MGDSNKQEELNKLKGQMLIFTLFFFVYLKLIPRVLILKDKND